MWWNLFENLVFWTSLPVWIELALLNLALPFILVGALVCGLVGFIRTTLLDETSRNEIIKSFRESSAKDRTVWVLWGGLMAKGLVWVVATGIELNGCVLCAKQLPGSTREPYCRYAVHWGGYDLDFSMGALLPPVTWAI